MQAREVPTSPKFRIPDDHVSPVSHRGWLLLSLVISILGGSAAGLVAAFWLVGQDRFAALLETPRNIIASPSRTATPWADIADRVQSRLVVFVRSRIPLSPLIDRGPLLDEDILGFGVRLTNDGWIVTPSEVLQDTEEGVDLLLENGELLPFKATATDPATGLVFGRVEGANGDAADFAEEATVNRGETGLALFPSLDLRSHLQTVMIRSLHAQSIREPKDLVRSSEALESRLGMGPWPTDRSGLGIAVNARGEIIGFEEGVQGDEARIIPLWHSRKIFDSLFRTGTIRRSRLGVSWVRPRSLPALKTSFSGDDRDAALIFSVDETGGVDPHGPAAKALQSGDLVRSVNGSRLTIEADLAEAIQSLDSGSIVSFEVLRDEKSLTLEVVLGSQE